MASRKGNGTPFMEQVQYGVVIRITGGVSAATRNVTMSGTSVVYDRMGESPVEGL